MKRTLLAVFATCVICLQGSAEDEPDKKAPQFKAVITCFNGKLDSKSLCVSSNFQPDGTLHPTGKMTCGLVAGGFHPPPAEVGQVSEIEWSFIEQRAGKDVYKFTRKFPYGSPAAITTSKDVEFKDSRIVIFEDKNQVVVMGPPDPRENLDTAVAEATRLIEAKEYKTLLTNFLPPAKLKAIVDTKPEKLDEMAKMIAPGANAILLKALNQIKLSPQFDDGTGNKVTVHLIEEIDGHKTLTWVKVEKYWYLEDLGN